MPLHIIIGAQWGDEGKGRITDLLAAEAQVVARYSGGDNAGHTVTVNGPAGPQIFKLHLLPSGLIQPHVVGVLGHGMVINPARLLEFLEPRGSRRLPHFKQLDLQIQKNFTYAGKTLGLIASVFNVMNKETVTLRRGSVGSETTNPLTNPTIANPTPSAFFNTASAWQRPRRFELGARIEF